MFNVIIIKGDKLKDYNFFAKKCAYYLKEKGKSGEGITIFSTGDNFVEKFATKYGITIQYFFPEWKKYGKNSLQIRDKNILLNANALIAFDDGTSEIHHLINEAKKLDIAIRIVKKESF